MMPDGPAMRALSAFLFPVVVAALISGCGSMSTRTGFYDPIAAELRTGSADSAVVMIETARAENKYGEKDRLLYFMDAGLLNHYAGHWHYSNEKLHLAESAAEELFTKSVSRAAASALLNDNVLEYSGEDYEVLYANLISALNYMALDQFEDAFVEIRRANLKLETLEQKYLDAARELERGDPEDTARIHIDYDIDKVRFHNDAFGRYLSMHLYAAEGKADDAEIDYSLLVDAFRAQPHIYDFEPPRVKYEPDEGAILSIVALAGLAPVKEALSLRLRTDKDLDLVQILYDGPGQDDTEYGHFAAPIGEDYYFKFAIPQLVAQPSVIDHVEVHIDGELVGNLQLLEDVRKVAEETFAARKSMIYFRTAARALFKGLAAHKAKKNADTGGLGGWLKKAAIDIATDLSENPDLRCCHYLPGRIFVIDLELPPGLHDIVVRYVGADGHVLQDVYYEQFNVRSAGLNLIQSNCLN